MSSKVAVVAGRAVALVFAVVWGFFVAFNVVFSDVFGIGEMLQAVAYVVIAYAVLGLVFGLAGPRTGWRWMWWIAGPGVVLVVMGLFDELSRALYHVAVIVAVLGGSAAGAWAGSWVRRRVTRGRATP